MVQTAERISQYEASDKVIFERSIFAYHKAAEIAGGHILELGSGMGYGLELLYPKSEYYTALDKFLSEQVSKYLNNKGFKFIQTKIPPFLNIDNESIDTIVTFQVIEHIKNDTFFIDEIFRVLKKGGKAIITTPNKIMSLTRNPWHIREYTKDSIIRLLQRKFNKIEVLGVYGNDKVDAYYNQNKQSVSRYTRFDILKMQYWLPRFVLQIPYDILNRINRTKLLSENNLLVNGIDFNDYHLKPADDKCFDLFVVVEKE